jgi:hypothetical protein
MNPDLYILLPPSKKEEYKKMQLEPTILPAIQIDENVPIGYAIIGDMVLKLPDAPNHTYTNSESKPINFEEMVRCLDSIRSEGIFLKYPLDGFFEDRLDRFFEDSKEKITEYLKRTNENLFLRCWNPF